MSSDRNEIENNKGKVPFEQALDEAGFGLYSWLMTALTGFTIIGFACIIYSSTIIVPTSACELGTTTPQQGLQIAIPLIALIVGSVVWGGLADKYGRRSMLLVSTASGATMTVLASISVSWVMLTTMQFMVTLLGSGMFPISMTLLSECVPAAKRNLVVIVVTSIFLLSQGIMALLAIPIIPLNFSYYLPSLDIYWNSWRTVLVVYALPSYLCGICLLFMHESPKYVFVTGDEAKSMEILRSIHRTNKGKNAEFPITSLVPDSMTQSGTEKPKAADLIVPLFKPPLRKPFLLLGLLHIMLQVNAFVLWLPTIMNQFSVIFQTGEGMDENLCGIIRLGLDAPPNTDLPPCSLNATALLFTFAVAGVQSFTNCLLTLVIDRVGRRNMVIIVTGVCGTCGILVNLVPNAVGSGLLFVVFVLSILCLGLYMAMALAFFPTHLRAFAVALTATGGRIAMVATSQILNVLFKSNCEVGFYTFTSMVAASAVVASFLPDERYLNKDKQKDESKIEENEEENNPKHLET